MVYVIEKIFNNEDFLYTDNYKKYFLKMENDKYIFLGDSYKDHEGDAKEVTQFIDDILDGKIQMEITTKSIPKTPVKLTEKNL